jgi:DNA-binding response OmpR family regulator
MSDDLVSFKGLIVSDVETERSLLRDCAATASFPVDWVDAPDTDIAGICRQIAQESLDFIFVDARLKQGNRVTICREARSASGRPLVISVGPTNGSAGSAQSDPGADGVLSRPIDPARASAMIDNCARARLPKHVLVVDDSSNVRAVVRKVLQASRFRLEIAEAADGNSAHEQIESRPFDLVLLDCNMPGVDGFATLERFKNSRADIPVVMITSTRDPRIADRARASGADEFMFKPFYAKDIDTILCRLFGLMGRVAA